MKAVRFVAAVFREHPRLFIVNLGVVLFVCLADTLALVSVAPVVDVVLDPALANPGEVTAKVVGAMAFVGIRATLLTLLLAFILSNLLRNSIYLSATYVMLRTKYSLLRRLVVGALQDFFSARWTFFSSRDQGVLLNTFSREMNVASDALGAMSYLLTFVVEAALYLTVPLLISWQVTIAGVLTAVALGLPFVWLSRLSYGMGQKNTATANTYISAVNEALASAKVVLGFGNQRQVTEQATAAFDAHRKAAIRSQVLTSGIPLAYYPIGLTVVAASLLTARAVEVPLSSVTVILYSFLKIVPLVGQIVGQKAQIENSLPSYEQVENLRRGAREERMRSGAREYAGFREGVALEGVSFRYEGERPTLEDVTLRVARGETVALLGPSGAGKSTAVDLLMGLIEPSEGRVLVDRRPLGEFDVVQYRGRIGYVPQDPILFNASVRDNLLWAAQDASDADLRDALEKAQATEFVSELPEGMDAVVGDRGVRLSGGQVQRLALARALVRRPDILVLDEATSALDSHSEALIQKAIDDLAGEATIVLVAHRLSTVRGADRVYVFDDGRVVEEGTFAELSAREGSYVQSMARMQGIG